MTADVWQDIHDAVGGDVTISSNTVETVSTHVSTACRCTADSG